MARIDSISIRKFRNLASECTLQFGASGVVLLGINGTGKTTLLNLLTSICQGNWELSADDYDLTFTMTCTEGTRLIVALSSLAEPRSEQSPSGEQSELLSALIARQRRVTLDIAIEFDNSEKLTVTHSGGRARYIFPDGTTAEREVPEPYGWMVLVPIALTFKRLGNQNWSDRILRVFAELFRMNRQVVRFDEGLDYFNLLTEQTTDGFELVAVKSSKSNEYVLDSFRTRLTGHTLAEKLLADYQISSPKFSFGYVSSHELEYLRKFCSLAGFTDAAIIADLDENDNKTEDATLIFRPLRFQISNDETKISHRHLSFGEKRLLSFLHYADEGDGPIIADELVNGLHREWIAACLERISNRQSFLSSQNPLLFDLMGFESVQEVTSKFVLCNHSQNREFSWSNMTADAAEEFFELYKTNIQHVSDILYTRGLW